MREPPRAAVEYHHHIRDLMDRQERSSRDRADQRSRAEQRAERGRDIAASKASETMAFWCRACRADFLAQCVLEVEADWDDRSQDVAFYRTKCFRGHWCIRLAVDRHRDPYYVSSRRVLADVGAHSADIIQPWETGYDLLYGHKNKRQ